MELTHPKPFSIIGVASYKLFRNAISIFLLQRPLSAPTRLPYLDGYGQKDVYLPVHIALPRCHPAPHLTLFVVYVHLLAHIKSWAELCSHIIAPLESAIAGQQSGERILWTDTLREQFRSAQTNPTTRKSITLPRPSDQLWIVTDGSVTKHGIGATLYITRNEKPHLAGFFSAKLRKHQVSWLPCEIEALSIAAAIKHFSPFIIQSTHQACLLTDSKPCVQGFEKLCRGEFSASPQVTSFLSIVSRYQVNVRHLAGTANVPSDFASRNAPECNEPRCQICNFVALTEYSVVRSTSVQDICGLSGLPFTTRSAWIQIQSECPDLRRTHAHLKQGTRPSKKITNIKDVKRYLNVATIAKDGLLVVHRQTPLSSSNDLIIVPRTVLDGLVTALHIKLDHLSKHQLQLVMKRQFYALDMPQVIDHVCKTCHTCPSLLGLYRLCSATCEQLLEF